MTSTLRERWALGQPHRKGQKNQESDYVMGPTTSPNGFHEKIPFDMLNRRQTISLHSRMVQPDCKGSTYFLERHAVREIGQSNGHKVQGMPQNTYVKALHTITFSSRVAKNLGNLLTRNRHKNQEVCNRDTIIFIYQQAMN